MKKRRFASLALALLLLLPACGKEESPGTSPDEAVPSPAVADSPEAAETEPEEEPPLAYLGEHDFSGRTYTMLVSGMDNSEWRQNPIDADAENPEIQNSMRFQRNDHIPRTCEL